MKNGHNLKVMLLAPMPPDTGGIANWSKMVCDYSQTVNDFKLVPINIGQEKIKTVDLTFFKRVVYGLLDLKNVTRLIKKNIQTVDVVHFTSTGSLSLFRDFKIARMCKKYNKPTVLHIRMGRIPEDKRKKNLEWFLYKRLFRNVGSIITIDSNTFEIVSKQRKGCVFLIPNPIDSNKTKLINDYEKKHQFNKIITYVGWIIKEKGVEELIKAFSAIKKMYPDSKLRLIGPFNTEYISYLKKTYSMESIEFFGDRTNAFSLNTIHESELFVFPSYTEGCPNVVLEAMLCKTPVIASSVGAIPDLLSGECGMLIPPRDEKSLVKCIDYLFSKQEKQLTLIRNSHKKIMDYYMLDTVFEKYFSVWEALLKAN